MSESDGVITYTIRLFERARRDIESAAVRLAAIESDRIAAEWLDGIEEAIAKLADNPRRCPLVAEVELFERETRQLLYPRTPYSVAYRLIFFVNDGNVMDTLDPPTVVIIHVRHAARKAISMREARDLRRDR